MQEIHSVGGGGSRFFGGGDRRLRPHNNQIHDLKCPRCDSLNTKFCYYNNYNLSQPRHFCKNCRRYWTKGGVLRNVPVGGGCRKTKRSKVKPVPETPKVRKSRSNSSSESSSLTGSTPITAIATATVTSADAGATPGTVSVKYFSSDIAPLSFPESRFFVPLQSTNSNFEQNVPEIGNFTDLMTQSTNNQTAVNFTDSSVSPFRLNHQNQQQFQLQKTTNLNHDETRTGFLDQTVDVSLPNFLNRSNGGGFTAFDWHTGVFETTGTVDDHVYWNQNQWSDHDNSLYLPPL